MGGLLLSSRRGGRGRGGEGASHPSTKSRIAAIGKSAVFLQNMSEQFVFEHVSWQPVLFGNKDFAQLMKKWNLDEFVTLKR